MDSIVIKKRIIEGLKRRAIRITPQRLAIIDVLSRDPTHPGVSSILKQVRERLPGISMSTVYYALVLLKKEGLIKELEFYDMENRYEIEMNDHVDLICTQCGRITNFASGFMTVTRKDIKEATGFEAKALRFEYYGLCAECRGGSNE